MSDLNRSIKIYIDGNDASKGIEDVKNKIQSLESKLAGLNMTEADYADKSQKLSKELAVKKKVMADYERKVKDTDRVLRNLSGATYNELQAVQTQVRKELKNAVRGTDQYTRALEQQRNVSRQLAIVQRDMRSEVGSQASIWSRSANFFNTYMGIIASGIAVITGVSMAFRALRDERNKLEDKAANLKALTGLDQSDVDWLTNEAKKLSTSVTEDGIRIRESASEIVDAFTLVGSAKPELLGNKDALKAVTEQTLILATAAKMDLKAAVDGVTMAMNQYGASADQASRYTNVLAAGSKMGSANVQSQTAAVIKAGVAAAGANIPFENLIGTIQTLAEKGIKDEIAGTGLKKFFLVLQTGAKDTNPAVVGLEKALENLNKKQLSSTEIKKLFGEEGYNVAKVLIDETEQVKYFTQAVTDSNIAVEQAAINSQTAEAKRAQAKNEMSLIGIELMEKLNPAITSAINLTVGWTKKVVELASWMSKNSGLIITVTATLAAYTLTVKVSTLWQMRSNDAIKQNIVWLKLKAVWMKVATAGKYAMAAATALFTGNIHRANVATKALFRTLSINPFVALAVGIAAVCAGLYIYIKNSKDAKDKSKLLYDVTTKASKSINDERIELNLLVAVAKNEKISKDERLKAIKRLNEIAPTYLGNLTLENINTMKAKKSIDDYTNSLIRNAKIKAIQEKISELSAKKLEMEAYKVSGGWSKMKERMIKEVDQEIEKYSHLYQEITGQTTELVDNDLLNKEKKKLDSLKKDQADLQLEMLKMKEKNQNESITFLEARLQAINQMIMDSQNKIGSMTPSTPKNGDTKLIDGVMHEYKGGKWVAVTVKDEASKDPLKLALQNQENSYQKELFALRKSRNEKAMTEDEYKTVALAAERKFYTDRMSILDRFLKAEKDQDKKAEIVKQQLDVNNKLLDVEERAEKDNLAKMDKSRKDRLTKLDMLYNAEKARLENSLSDQSISQQEYDALLLALEMADSENRLQVAKDYHKECASLELINAKTKEKIVTESGEALSSAELKVAQNRSKQAKVLNNLVTDFKTEFKLFNIDEELDMQLKLLEANYQARMHLALKYDLEFFEIEAAYQQARANLIGNAEQQKNQIRGQYGLISVKKQHDMELEALAMQHRDGLINEEEYQKARFNIQVNYLKQSFDYYSNLFSGAMSALQDAEMANIDAKYDVEIERAQGNSEEVGRLENEKAQKKLDIEKKYADVNFAIQVAQIIANTAVAIMQSFAQLGPIGGAIAAVLMGVTGAAQIAAANAERKKVKNMTLGSSGGGEANTGARVVNQQAEGKYDVIGQDDHKLYRDVPYAGTAKTGIVSQPTLVGESGSELVVSSPDFLRLQRHINYPLIVSAIRDVRSGNNIVKQQASGKYDAIQVSATPAKSVDNTELLEIIRLNTEIMRDIKRNGINALVSLTDIDKKNELRNKARDPFKRRS